MGKPDWAAIEAPDERDGDGTGSSGTGGTMFDVAAVCRVHGALISDFFLVWCCKAGVRDIIVLLSIYIYASRWIYDYSWRL